MVWKLYLIIRDFSAKMKKKDISTYAASTAFFFFLSVVPMLIMICTIIPYTPLTEENLVELVTDFLPDQIDPLAESLISEVYDKSAGILSVALIATVWSAAKGVMALMKGLNSVNGVEEKRNYFVLRIIASFYTVVMLVVVILSLFVMVFGDQLVTLALHRIPQLQRVVSFAMNFRFLFVGGAFRAVRGGVRLCAGQKAGVPGADTRRRFFSRGLEYFFMGVFLLCDLRQFLRHLRQPFHYHHCAAVDVFLYVYHSHRRVSEPVFRVGKQKAGQ